MQRRDSDWPLVLGVLASAVLHGGMAWTSIQASAQGWLDAPLPPPASQTAARLAFEPIPAPAEDPEPPPPEPKPPEEEAVRLGIADSDADTETWVGVRPEEAGAAVGPRSQVDQAAFALPAGVPDLPLISTPQTELPPSLTDATPAPMSESALEARPPDAPIGAPALPEPQVAESSPRDEQNADALEALEIPQRDEAMDESEAEPFTPMVVDPIAAPGAPKPAQTEDPLAFEVSRPEDSPQGLPPPPAQPAAPPPTVSGGVVDELFPGEISDRESEAAAIREAIDVVPGRPAAGKGLEVKTVRPRWSHFTLLTANPRDAVVRVSFNRHGKVEEVEFLRSTGRDDVDRPLKDAIYNWTATGKDLEALAPPTQGQPVETVKLVFRLILRS